MAGAVDFGRFPVTELTIAAVPDYFRAMGAKGGEALSGAEVEKLSPPYDRLETPRGKERTIAETFKGRRFCLMSCPKHLPGSRSRVRHLPGSTGVEIGGEHR